MQSLGPRARRLVLSGAALLVLLSLLSLVLGWRELRRLVADTDWALMPAALGASALSYAALSYAFALINASVGIAVPRRMLVTIGFVSITLSQFAAGGGMAGYAVRLVLLRQRGSVPADILAASLLYSSLSGLVLLALLPVGLGYLLVAHPLSGHIMTGIILVVGLLLVLVVLTTGALFVGCVRRPLRSAVAGGWRRLTGRDGMTTALHAVDAGLSRAMARSAVDLSRSQCPWP